MVIYWYYENFESFATYVLMFLAHVTSGLMKTDSFTTCMYLCMYLFFFDSFAICINCCFHFVVSWIICLQ